MSERNLDSNELSQIERLIRNANVVKRIAEGEGGIVYKNENAEEGKGIFKVSSIDGYANPKHKNLGVHEIDIYRVINELKTREVTPYVMMSHDSGKCINTQKNMMDGKPTLYNKLNLPPACFKAHILHLNRYNDHKTFWNWLHEVGRNDETKDRQDEFELYLIQVLWTLIAFEKIGLYQNDLHGDNVMLVKNSKKEDTYTSFKYKDDKDNVREFFLPNKYEYEVRVYDFDRAVKLQAVEEMSPVFENAIPLPRALNSSLAKARAISHSGKDFIQLIQSLSSDHPENHQNSVIGMIDKANKRILLRNVQKTMKFYKQEFEEFGLLVQRKKHGSTYRYIQNPDFKKLGDRYPSLMHVLEHLLVNNGYFDAPSPGSVVVASYDLGNIYL